MTARDIVSLLLESPPDVEEEYAKLVPVLTELYTKCVVDKENHGQPKSMLVQAFAAAANRDQFLSACKISVHDTAPNAKIFHGSCNRETGAIKLWVDVHTDLKELLGTLRHELVHREQFKRAAGKASCTSAEARAQRAFDKAVNSRLYDRTPVSPQDVTKANNARMRAYIKNPREIQARGVQAAGDVQGDPAYRVWLRAGMLRGAPHYDASATGQKARNRFFKNAYQYLDRQA